MIVFFGKSGSNAVNLVDLKFPIKAGFTNHKDSTAIEVFKENNIPVYVVSSNKEILEILNEIDHKLIVLMGYLRILPKEIVDNFKIINLHPSYLPEHKGLKAFERSIESNSGQGLTLHWVNEDLDSGTILFQVKLDYTNLPIKAAECLLKFKEYTLIPNKIKSIYNFL